MPTPDPGFSQPCSSDCAEFNARGCPGNTPFCVTSPFVALDYQVREVQRKVDDLFDQFPQHLPVSLLTTRAGRDINLMLESLRDEIADAQIAAKGRTPVRP